MSTMHSQYPNKLSVIGFLFLMIANLSCTPKNDDHALEVANSCMRKVADLEEEVESLKHEVDEAKSEAENATSDVDSLESRVDILEIYSR